MEDAVTVPTALAARPDSVAHQSIPSRRLLIVRVLLVIATVGAVGAAISQLPVVLAADGATTVVQTWRLYGFVLFAGLFALLAFRPLGNLTVWLLVIGNKLALTVTAFAYQAHGGIADTGQIIVWDGGLTVVLLAAFLLSRNRRNRRSSRNG
jgi:hypothetical protein